MFLCYYVGDLWRGHGPSRRCVMEESSPSQKWCKFGEGERNQRPCVYDADSMEVVTCKLLNRFRVARVVALGVVTFCIYLHGKMTMEIFKKQKNCWHYQDPRRAEVTNIT